MGNKFSEMSAWFLFPYALSKNDSFDLVIISKYKRFVAGKAYNRAVWALQYPLAFVKTEDDQHNSCFAYTRS